MDAGNFRRLTDLQRFYALLDALDAKAGGKRLLATCHGRMSWPQRGVYFFFEQGEVRTDTGPGQRVVRVGTHALTNGSSTRLWSRLAQHRGTKSGGNHRGSIFRLLIGTALISQSGNTLPTWGQNSSAPKHIRDNENELEDAVNAVIRTMPFLSLPIED